jgi:asparagine synthase (glutamine-hydrolysing)
MKNDPCVQLSQHLHELLTESILKTPTPPEEFSVLYSGGLDSSVITALLIDFYSETFQLIVAGINTAKDIILARKGAEALKLPLTLKMLTMDEVEESLPTILSILGQVDVLHVELAIPLFFAARCATQFGVTTLYSGQGADELFGGYAKYEKRFLKSGEEAVLTEMKSDIQTLNTKTLPSMKAIVSHHNCQLLVPFCDEAIIEFSMSIPLSCKIALDSEEVIRKHVLRLLASDLGLPPGFVQAPKRALQYGSGAHRILTNLAVKYWAEHNPKLTRRQVKTHARVEQYLTQLIDQ